MSVGMVGRNANPYNSLNQPARETDASKQNHVVKSGTPSEAVRYRDGKTETPVLKMYKPDGSTHVLYKSSEKTAADFRAESVPALSESAMPRAESVMPEKTVLKIYGPDGRERGYSSPSSGSAAETRAPEHTHEMDSGGCKTCSERLYQDKSTDAGVSFQNPGHINPSMSLSMVSSHEMEHVVRESRDAELNDQKVIAQSVEIHLSRCPECSRLYAAGGETRIAKMQVVQPADRTETNTARPRFDMAI